MSFRAKSQGLGIPLGLGYMDIQLNGPTELPTMPLPVNNSIHTNKERSIAAQYITHLNNLNESVFNLGRLNDKEQTDLQPHVDRYSDKYSKSMADPLANLNIDNHPFHLDVFPKELYNVMGINKKKLLQLAKLKSNQDTNNPFNLINANGMENGLDNDDSMGLNMLQKLKELADEVDELDENGNLKINSKDGKNSNNNGQLAEEDDLDDDFDEDEDEDDDNDYNAEKYFNNGDDDDMDDDGNDDEPAF